VFLEVISEGINVVGMSPCCNAVCVYNMKTRTSAMHIYHKGNWARSANDVCPFVCGHIIHSTCGHVWRNWFCFQICACVLGGDKINSTLICLIMTLV